jgi:YggT family protein
MFIFANLLGAIAQVLDYILWAYLWILIGRVIISFFNVDEHNPIVRFLYTATEPVLAPLRRRLPGFGDFDFSPIVAWLAVIFLKRFLVGSLYELARRLS